MGVAALLVVGVICVPETAQLWGCLSLVSVPAAGFQNLLWICGGDADPHLTSWNPQIIH